MSIMLCVGEFGIVYRGIMTNDKCVPQAVAVKTLKGIILHRSNPTKPNFELSFE